VNGIVLAAVATVAAHASSALDAADAALAKGDAAAASKAAAVAWAYVGSPVFRSWNGATRAQAKTRAEGIARRVASLNGFGGAAAARDVAKQKIAEAKAAARAVDAVAPFTDGATAADACTMAIGALTTADRAWPVPPAGESLDALATECTAMATEAKDGAASAKATAEQRAAELTSVLKGDRRGVFADHGEPMCDGCDSTEKIAKAPVWIYKSGPTGALATYETLTFTFKGDTLVAQHERTAHEKP
jgi:hypothetical protein